MTRSARIATYLPIMFASLLSACNIDSHFIYIPQPISDAVASRITQSSPSAEEIVLSSADGVRLHGWIVNHRDQGMKPLLIYYGGNADEVSWLLAHAHRFRGYALLLMNYRGYGRSEGVPRQDRLFADALVVFDAITARPGIDRQRVVVWGRSLGTGVATHVAIERSVAGVVLVSPYDSMSALAERHMPYLKWLLTQPFDSLSLAPRIKVPLLALAAVQDTLIPIEHSERVVSAWGGPKRLVVLREGDHNSLTAFPAFWGAIDGFLTSYESR
ncbi:MAG: alpha/beta hydrolase [Burkholderiales bacterium]